MWRLVYGVPLWLVAGFIKLVVVILGYVVVPIAALLKMYEMTEARPLGHPKHYDGDKYNWKYWWLKPWDNFDDGIANRNYKQFDSMFWQIVYWSCFRNPANGLREMPITSVRVKPLQINYITDLEDIRESKARQPHWFFCWQGLYMCYFNQYYNDDGELKRIWLGYKLIPRDKMGISPDDYRYRGAVMTFQFKRIEVR